MNAQCTRCRRKSHSPILPRPMKPHVARLDTEVAKVRGCWSWNGSWRFGVVAGLGVGLIVAGFFRRDRAVAANAWGLIMAAAGGMEVGMARGYR